MQHGARRTLTRGTRCGVFASRSLPAGRLRSLTIILVGSGRAACQQGHRTHESYCSKAMPEHDPAPSEWTERFACIPEPLLPKSTSPVGIGPLQIRSFLREKKANPSDPPQRSRAGRQSSDVGSEWHGRHSGRGAPANVNQVVTWSASGIRLMTKEVFAAGPSCSVRQPRTVARATWISTIHFLFRSGMGVVSVGFAAVTADYTTGCRASCRGVDREAGWEDVARFRARGGRLLPSWALASATRLKESTSPLRGSSDPTGEGPRDGSSCGVFARVTGGVGTQKYHQG